MTTSQKPLVLYAVPPREGHMRPALQITSHLSSLGFDVTVLGTQRWRPAIEAAGAHFSPIIGLWATLDDPSRWPSIASASSPASRLAASLSGGFVTLLPSGLESVRYALAAIRRRRPGREKIVVLSDTCFSGTLALKLGADLPEGFEQDETIRSVGIGVVPTFWTSAERPPWGSGLPIDASSAGRQRNIRTLQETWDSVAEERARWILTAMNCPRPLESLYSDLSPATTRHPFWDASTICHDATLQMCLPGLEPTSSDWPERIKFAGTLPIKPPPADQSYPVWFSEIFSNSASICSSSSRKKIVFVAQGTEVLNHEVLLLPTLSALADREDVLVVACLCVKNAALDTTTLPDGRLPQNARVADYIPYDAVLAHADVFVSNSGYGGFSHAVANGVPMVQAGDTFDKPDIGRRVEWSGLGVFLEESPAQVDKLRTALDRVLGEDGFKRRAEELRGEARGYDPLGMVGEEILRVAGL
ncbi:UDP-glucuronosyl/UDP-glucosyltransferase [Colletotrichum musicola]|uniref:UDP-glucuronosyl/UDP-glucosyltransferase n=1 Tax=Colletotrichum musicola TaxID=2175873 RepID=A0A8H6K4C7_9PEZI|nr:UDP-glucuronosyl/UDP-glucosyltransferase [Colletotrichum musicola]